MTQETTDRPPAVAPTTISAAMAVQRVLLSRRGRFVSLCAPEAIGALPVLTESKWPELARDLDLPAHTPVRVLTIPWERSFGAPPNAYVEELSKDGDLDVHACVVVTSSGVPGGEAIETKPSAPHMAIVDAIGRTITEAPGEATSLQQLPHEANLAPAGTIDPAKRMRDFAADVKSMAAFRERLGSLTAWAPVTATLCVACAVVFGVMVLSGVPFMTPRASDLEPWGANGGFLVAQGQWWRLLASAFIHAGVIHLLVNLWCLWHLGQFIERLFGSATFTAIYVLAAAGGALASIATKPLVVSVGASGAVFGICGALLGFLLVQRKAIPKPLLKGMAKNMVVLIGLNLLFGMTIRAIDNAAHVGGLATGFVCGLVLSRNLEREHAGRLALRMVFAAALAGCLVASALVVNRVVLQSPKWRSLMFVSAYFAEYEEKVRETARTAAKDLPRNDEGWVFRPELRTRLEQHAERVRSAIGGIGKWPPSSVRDMAVRASETLAGSLESFYSLARTGKQRYLEETRRGFDEFAEQDHALLIEADRLWRETFGERLIEER